MSDELELMMLAVKNYAKSEYNNQGLNDEDTKLLFELRKWIKSEMENRETFLRATYVAKDSHWDREFGSYRCIDMVNNIVSN